MEQAEVLGRDIRRDGRVHHLPTRCALRSEALTRFLTRTVTEMKTTRQQLERSVALPESYDSFFSFPTHKGGYSGVAVYTKRSDAVPLKAEEGLSARLQPKPALAKDEQISERYPDIDDIELMPNDDGRLPQDVLELDCEGRALILDFGLFVLFNLYCPAETSETRTPFKVCCSCRI